MPVVVDTDLAPDDLAALALLLRHPGVRVVAVTVPMTGELDCRGTGLLGDFFQALEVAPPPVACGTTPRGEDGVMFPPDWGAGALMSSGLPRDGAPSDLTPVHAPAAGLIARLARRHDDLQVVALAPLTEVAAVLRQHPAAYARIDGIITMAGSVDSPSHADGVAEWNAGADPVPFAEVLAGPVPVTVVPDDPVPPGAPDGLTGPVVGGLGRVAGFESPRYWDLATAGTFVAGPARDRVGHVDGGHDRRPRRDCDVRATGRCAWSPSSTPLRSTRSTAASSADCAGARLTQARPSSRVETSRISTLRTLPVTVIGNSSTTMT